MMYLKIVIIKFVLLLTIINIGFAQNPNACIDTTQIWPGTACYPDYSPVCGCDSVTYRNICFALRYNGVQYWEDGICEALDFDFYPNPITDYYSFLELTLITRYETDIVLQIMDIYGKKYYEYTYRNVSKFGQKVQINLSGYKHGLYVIVAQSRGEYVIKKFMKIDY